jgi:hypothetical protein
MEFVTKASDPDKSEWRDAAVILATEKLQFELRRAPELWVKTEADIERALSRPCDWRWQGSMKIERPSSARYQRSARAAEDG